LGQILPLIGSVSSGGLSSIISLLEEILPVAVKEAEALVPSIQNILAAIEGSGAVTPAQLSSLASLSAQYDAAFDAAATADGVPPSPVS
jgi:hypothetical protein